MARATEKVYVADGESARDVQARLPEPPPGYQWVRETSTGTPSFTDGQRTRTRFALREREEAD